MGVMSFSRACWASSWRTGNKTIVVFADLAVGFQPVPVSVMLFADGFAFFVFFYVNLKRMYEVSRVYGSDASSCGVVALFSNTAVYKINLNEKTRLLATTKKSISEKFRLFLFKISLLRKLTQQVELKLWPLLATKCKKLLFRVMLYTQLFSLTRNKSFLHTDCNCTAKAQNINVIL